MRNLVLRLAMCATMLAVATSVRAQGIGSSESSEYLIKAGYVYNFAKLVEWPASAARRGQPMVIGVLVNDAFATVLERVVGGKKIDDRSILVKRLKSQNYRECGCQMLFVAASEIARADEVIQFQNTASVLTISEAPEFARRGGVIALTLEDSKVRFMVNVDAAQQASLNISSRLLTLASVVHTAR